MRLKITFLSFISAVAMVGTLLPAEIFAVGPPNDPTSLTQQEGESGAPQPVGWNSRLGDAIYFKAFMTTPGPDVSLEVETKLIATAFTGSGTEISPAVTNGMTATIPSSVTANGSYHWRARERYTSGATSNWVSFGGNTEDVADFTIDTVPPDTTIASSPASSTTDTTASFSFVSSEGSSTFACQLDNGSFASCSSPQSYSGLATGSHTFQVRATDAAGNTDLTPASYSWTITVPTDTTPPDTTIASSPASSTTDTSAAFSFTATESATFACSLDGATYSACASPRSFTGLATGSHTFAVRATDLAGNTDPTPAAYSWTITAAAAVDTTPPVGPDKLSRTTSDATAAPTFIWSAATDNVGVTSYEVQMDAGAFANIGNQLSFTSSLLPNGAHTVSVRARDAAGNVSFPATLTFTIAAPSVAVFPTGFAAGDLVKLPDDHNPNTFGDTALFYLGADGNRYVFPNEKIFKSWYPSFAGTKLISVADLASVPLRGVVTYRPGVRMVKLQTNPTVYVVSRNGLLHAVPSEAVAVALYGSNWNHLIDDVNDAFWSRYTIGIALVSASDYSPIAATATATSISVDKGL